MVGWGRVGWGGWTGIKVSFFLLTIKFTNLNYRTLQVSDETKFPEGAMTPLYFFDPDPGGGLTQTNLISSDHGPGWGQIPNIKF